MVNHHPSGVWTRTSPLSKRMSVGMTTKPNWLTARQERVDTGKARLVTFQELVSIDPVNYHV